MTYEIEINEQSETGKKIFSFLNDLGISYSPKVKLLKEQKALLKESLAELAEGEIKTQQQVIDDVKKWLKSK